MAVSSRSATVTLPTMLEASRNQTRLLPQLGIGDPLVSAVAADSELHDVGMMIRVPREDVAERLHM